MKKWIVFLLLTLSVVSQSRADEGMWLLPMLEKLNIKDMKARGLKLSARDIYDVNGSSLKDAVVIFGGGCTGEIVSPEGLLLTNHHCGFASIQALSSVEHDYLRNGFWAMERREELPVPGLSVRFIRQIEEVTEPVLQGVTEQMSEKDRTTWVEQNITALMEQKKAQYPGMEILVKDFFGGNQYLLFAIEVYRDIRLVGAPPQSIGKFGGETDNWMWPRHTGDFSVFRVYATPEGKPAEYAAENVPYQTSNYLKISLKGYDEGDFAMIMGFPGSTERYMTSWEIDQTLQVDNPTRILIRGLRQDILKRDMAASDAVRIQYASKFASSSNYWKNSIGMSRGLVKLGVKAEKEALEREFTAWANASSDRTSYQQALPLIEQAVRERIPHARLLQYFSETMGRAVEICKAAEMSHLLSDSSALTDEQMENIRKTADNFYKDYNMPTDREVARVMFRLLADSLSEEELPSVFEKVIKARFGGNTDRYVEELYARSVFADQAKFEAYLAAGDFSQIGQDPAVVLYRSVAKKMNEARKKLTACDADFNRGHRLFIAGLLEMDKERKHYPDANFTIRLTYGNILPYDPADGVTYRHYTTLSGVIAKEDPKNPTEFTVPEKLKELYRAKDFGRYAYRGDVPVAFLSNNDITGGNSGSPVMNSRGELLGLAFDGNWEAMSGDIAFEPELQRTICVDIRYVLFLIDKFAGAGYLLDEMTLVE